MPERDWLAALLIWPLFLLGMITADLVGGLLAGTKFMVCAEWVTYAFPLAAIFFYVRRSRRKFWSAVGARRENLGPGIIWVLALFVVFSALLTAYDGMTGRLLGRDLREEISEHFERESEELGLGDWYFGYMLASSFLLTGLFEELIFRGFVLDRLLSGGPVFAIGLSSLMHASLHPWYFGFGTAAGALLCGSAFLFFVWMGIAYFKTRNLVGVALMHGLNNALFSVEKLWGDGAVELISAGITLAGAVCLMHLLFAYMRRSVGQPKVKAQAVAQGVASERAMLERALRRMRELLGELRKRYAREELSREDYLRLRDLYKTRMKDVEEALKRA